MRDEAAEARARPASVDVEVIMQEPAHSAGGYGDIVLIILDPK